MKMIYVIAADVLKALGWEVEINEKESYWNLVLTNTTSSEDMPQSHKSCLRGLLRGWLMEFNFEGGRQQVNIYKDLHGLNPEDDRYSCLDTCVNRADGNTPQSELNDKEIFVRRKDRFDRYVLAEPATEETRQTVFEREDDADQPLTEQAAYDEYQERSGMASERAGQLAWAFIFILCAQLIGGLKYAQPYIIAAGGIGYMLLSSLQSLWQAVTMWMVKQRIRKGYAYEDYPSWVGGGAWVFYYGKMAVITVTAVYAIYTFSQLI